MTIYLQKNNIDMRALQILQSLYVGLHCDFIDGTINVCNEIFIDSPYTADKIRGNLSKYSHIKTIVENVWANQ